MIHFGSKELICDLSKKTLSKKEKSKRLNPRPSMAKGRIPPSLQSPAIVAKVVFLVGQVTLDGFQVERVFSNHPSAQRYVNETISCEGDLLIKEWDIEE